MLNNKQLMLILKLLLSFAAFCYLFNRNQARLSGLDLAVVEILGVIIYSIFIKKD